MIEHFEHNNITAMLNFAKFRAAVAEFNQQNEADKKRSILNQEAQAFLAFLATLPVSVQSKFLEEEWDFNDDFPNASRYVRGTKLRINFGKYEWLPSFAVLELKAAFIMHYKCLSVVDSSNDALPTLLTPVKPNTVIAQFESGLRYFDKIYQVAASELGKEHVFLSMDSLSSLPSHYYSEAALDFDYVFDASLQQFFKAIRSQQVEDGVFGTNLPNVNLSQLKWKKLGKAHRPEKDVTFKRQILSNQVFESASLIGSLAIVDFLDAMGEVVIDQSSLSRRNAKNYHASQDAGLTVDKFNMYVYRRLAKKGHSVNDVAKVLGHDVVNANHFFTYESFTAQKKFGEESGSPITEEFREYLNFVNYACQYIVGQYTGMRPSELAEVLATDQCLVRDSRFCLIRSHVSKNEDNLVQLFDDFWVAIPIVQDAVRACIILNKYKNNKYLFSNMDTVALGKPAKPYGSSGYKWAFDNFFSRFLPEEVVAAEQFNVYMLRHTLAYQLYRADLALPFISHQLKHFGEFVGIHSKGFSQTTLGYGEIGDLLAKGGGRNSDGKNLRHMAEVESVKSFFDPDGNYAGLNADAHKQNMHKVFQGYMAAGYSKDDIFEEMAAQHIAIVNIGQGFCYGGKANEFDSSLPCIGGLRCNPNRCKNSVISAANAPKWREVYYQNQMMLENPAYSHTHDQSRAAMEEALGVLKLLGEEV